MNINISEQKFKEAFSSYEEYIKFLVRLSKEDKEIKLPYYNLFADVFASNGEAIAYIYSDGKTVTMYCEGVIKEINTISESVYDLEYILFMCRQYENEQEVIINGSQ